MYLDRAKALFAEVNARVHLAEKVIPCTSVEVDRLEQQVGISLPEAYKEFLLWMGHGAGGFLQGENVFYQDLPLNEDAHDLLQEDNIAVLMPEDSFVFYMHQGYQFMFLRPVEGPNPPVYYYGEEQMDYFAKEQNGQNFTVLYESFSNWLIDEIEAQGRLREERARLHALRLERQQESKRRKEESGA